MIPAIMLLVILLATFLQRRRDIGGGGDAYISVFIKSGANLVSKLFEVPKMYLRAKTMQLLSFKPWLLVYIFTFHTLSAAMWANGRVEG